MHSQEKGKVFFLKASLETLQKDTLNVMKENAFKGCFKERKKRYQAKKKRPEY